MNTNQPTADARALRLAGRRFGVLTVREANGSGLTSDQCDDRVRKGTLLRPARGVLVAAGAPDTPQQRLLIALAASPLGACASFLTAAAIYCGWAFPPIPHVTIDYGRSPRSRVAITHRSRLDPADVRRIGLFWCTSPARTLIDCAAVLAAEQLQELVDRMFDRELVTYDEVLDAIARASAAPGRKGIPALRAAIAAWAPGIEHDSVQEARMFRLVVSWGFPAPQTLFKVFAENGLFIAEVDAAWPEHRVALEYEGSKAHCPTKWVRDEPRYGRLLRVRWSIVPVTSTDLRPRHHERLRADIASHLRTAR